MSKTMNAGSIDPLKMLTYAEVADLFGVTERQVRRWVEEGKIATVE